ncbi:MAG: hypothetical protein WD810_00150 [Solirubrobacterales bacterium]
MNTEPQKSEPLKTATAAVGLLAGIVASVYVLGGLVIALRMFFDSFTLNSVVTIVGQLPRELVISTAMLDVLLPAAALGLSFGLLAAFVTGVWRVPLRKPASGRVGLGTIVFLVGVTAALVAPAIVHALLTNGPTLSLLSSVIGILTTFAAAYAGWYELRSVAGGAWSPAAKLCAAGGIAAAVTLTPAVMFAASLSLEQAQACVSGSEAPVKGKLIGEGGGQVLLEQHFGKEAGVVSIPSSQVTKIEYGDIASTFSCPAPPGESAIAKVAEARLGGHGTAVERRLATELRPRLRFDSEERWRPLEVGGFLAERFHRRGVQQVCWEGAEARCEPAAGLEQLRRGPDAPDYIDILGEAKGGGDFESPQGSCRSAPAVDCNDGAQAVIYYRRTTHEGRWYWDYWWFLRFNDYSGHFNDCDYYCADHEGDWEGMTVITTPSLTPEILGAIYAAHKDRVLVEAAALPRSGGHPLVFVADGTHASYPFRCAEEHCEQFGTLVGFRLPEEGHDGDVAWGGNGDAACALSECVRPLPEVGHPTDTALPLAGEWAGWSGKWGRTCVRGCDSAESSPSSPGAQVRFRCPWAPTRWARLSPDGTVSASERAGDAERLRAACEAQRGGD